MKTHVRAGLLMGVLACAAAAGPIQVTSLNPDDNLSFSFTSGVPVTSPFTVGSAGGLSATFSSSQNFQSLRQPDNWVGNFPDGMRLIEVFALDGVTINFSQAIRGFAISVDAGNGTNYTATLKAYNGPNLLGTFSASGDRTALVNLAILSSALEITSVNVSTNQSVAVGQPVWAFGTLNFVTKPLPTITTEIVSTPEPGTLGSAGFAIVAIAIAAVRRRRS
jgi:hypothetical protein